MDTEHLIAIGIGRPGAGGAAVRLRRAELDRRGAAVAAAAQGGAAPPGHLERPLVPDLLGPGPRRLAHLPGGPDDAEITDRTAVLAPGAARRRRRELHRRLVPRRRMAVPRRVRPARAGRRDRRLGAAAGRRRGTRTGPLPGARRVVVVGPAGRLGRDVRRRHRGRRAGRTQGGRRPAQSGGMQRRPGRDRAISDDAGEHPVESAHDEGPAAVDACGAFVVCLNQSGRGGS